MKIIIAILLLLTSLMTKAQFPETRFPAAWEGTWTGMLDLMQSNQSPMQVYNELRIEANATADTVEFTIVYGTDSSDIRSYRMLRNDSLQGGWVLDELDGILIQCAFVGDKLVNLFQVQNTMLFVSYQMLDRELLVEMFSFSFENPLTSGGSSDEVPEVLSYPLQAVTRTVLIRQ